MPLAQRDGDPLLLTYFYIAVRSASGSPALLTRSVTAALTAVNPDLTLTFRPLSTVIDDSLAQDRLVAMLSGFFGVLALLLAGLGLYGVTAYAVARRRTEIGIRMALGAPPARVVRLVAARVALLVGAGVIVGAAVSLWASTVRRVAGLRPGAARSGHALRRRVHAGGGRRAGRLAAGVARVPDRSGGGAPGELTRAHAPRNARRKISLRSVRDSDGRDISIRATAATTAFRTARVIGSRVNSKT